MHEMYIATRGSGLTSGIKRCINANKIHSVFTYFCEYMFSDSHIIVIKTCKLGFQKREASGSPVQFYW